MGKVLLERPVHQMAAARPEEQGKGLLHANLAKRMAIYMLEEAAEAAQVPAELAARVGSMVQQMVPAAAVSMAWEAADMAAEAEARVLKL